MACAGVVASAGAQLDFTVMTVASRTSGKSTFFGFNNSTSTGGLSKSDNKLEFADGTRYECTVIEDEGNVIRVNFASAPSGNDDTTSFNSIIIGALRIDRSSGFVSTTNYGFTSGSTAISAANGSTIIVQIRAD